MAGDPALSKYLSDDELVELVSIFPAVEFAFAYGSGVIQQQVDTTICARTKKTTGSKVATVGR